MGNYKLQVEAALRHIPRLDYVILRPAMVYGVGDKTGLGKLVHSFCNHVHVFASLGYVRLSTKAYISYDARLYVLLTVIPKSK